MTGEIRRRTFLALFYGAAAAWPLAARAQPRPERMRRVGVLNYLAEDDPDSSPRVAAFAQALQELGWHDGRNIQIDYRWGGGDLDHGNRHRTRHLLNQEFMQALLLNFRHEGKRAIEKVARNQPAAYLKILALLVPREHKVEHSNALKNLSDEQLEAMIAYLETSLAAQAGGPVKVIEGMIEPTTVPATALPVLEPPKRKPNRLMIEVDTAIGPQERIPRKMRPPAGE
jgi:hypothetical protein